VTVAEGRGSTAPIKTSRCPLNSSSSVLASFRSAVSKHSVNQPRMSASIAPGSSPERADNSNVLLQSGLAQVRFPTSVHGFVLVYPRDNEIRIATHEIRRLCPRVRLAAKLRVRDNQRSVSPRLARITAICLLSKGIASS
jgi:hypothetical protein